MYRGKKVLGVITARGGSKGIPGKNIKKFGGKPLIVWTIESAKKSDCISRLIVSTDSEKIAKVAKKRKTEVPFMRPAELSGDNVPHTPVMQHALRFMEKTTGDRFDYLVILQPTSPFRIKEDIDGPIRKMIDEGADSAVTVYEVDKKQHPMKLQKIENGFVFPYFAGEAEKVRRQDIPPIYRRNGAIYAMSREYLLSRKPDELSFGGKSIGHIMPAERSVDIDTPMDWKIAELMLKDLRAKGQFK